MLNEKPHMKKNQPIVDSIRVILFYLASELLCRLSLFSSYRFRYNPRIYASGGPKSQNLDKVASFSSSMFRIRPNIKGTCPLGKENNLIFIKWTCKIYGYMLNHN